MTSELNELKESKNENTEMYRNENIITGENVTIDTLETFTEESYYSDSALKETTEGKIQMKGNSYLDLQILEIIEKCDGLWKCKVCGKSVHQKRQMQNHAERHIEGMSHICHICNKSFSTRPSLRSHIKDVHSELLSCDLCGRSGMTKKNYYSHMSRQHKIMSGALS